MLHVMTFILVVFPRAATSGAEQEKPHSHFQAAPGGCDGPAERLGSQQSLGYMGNRQSVLAAHSGRIEGEATCGGADSLTLELTAGY